MFKNEQMWAILNDKGELACWRGSRGVPFMSPSRQLVEDTLRDLDVIDPVSSPEIISVVVIVLDERTVVLGNHSVLTVLVPTPAAG